MNLQSKTEPFKINNIEIGGNKIILVAGPCAIETENQIKNTIENMGVFDFFRAGAYKNRTSVTTFAGLREKGLDILKSVKKKYNKPVVTEITDINMLKEYEESVDIIQVGARNMQNIELLKTLGKSNKPILLKRGFGNTIEELISAAEYIENEGNNKIIFCERGIRTFENSTRFTLDISSVPVIKSKSKHPVFVDPSHAAGDSRFVESLTLAAVAAGADGIMVEVHFNPEEALSDKKQAITPEEYNKIVSKTKLVAEAIGRKI